MSAKQTTTTTTTTTRGWNGKKKKKSVAKAYSAQLKKAKKSGKKRCPTCGKPL